MMNILALCFSLYVAMVGPASTSVLDDFAQAWMSISAYHVTVSVFEQRNSDTYNRVLAYQFEKPSHAVMRVVSGKNAGATLTWNGGDTLVARKGSGLMSMFTKTFSIHDPIVTTLRGSSIDELSYGAILARLQQHQQQIMESRSEAIEGVPTVTLSLVSASALAPMSLNREDIIFSQKSHLPIRVLDFEENALVRQVDFQDLVLH